MFRSALAWVLTTAVLVTLPVTGAGRCPCRVVKSLRTQPAPQTARPTPEPATCGECCKHHREVPRPGTAERPQDATPPAAPDAPCDHGPSPDTALTVARDPPGAESPADQCASIDVSPARVESIASEPTRGPPVVPLGGRAFLRFAHALRC
jgi:hypothetical protein